MDNSDNSGSALRCRGVPGDVRRLPASRRFYTLKRMKLTVMGDIGCYTLGAIAPLEAMDACICMGASIGTALGLEKARGVDYGNKVVAVIGDSTFVHSGITALIDVVYNQGTSTVLILDNETTAMTGHQDHPATGRTIRREPTSAWIWNNWSEPSAFNM